jgi:hypothetical protein
MLKKVPQFPGRPQAGTRHFMRGKCSGGLDLFFIQISSECFIVVGNLAAMSSAKAGTMSFEPVYEFEHKICTFTNNHYTSETP